MPKFTAAVPKVEIVSAEQAKVLVGVIEDLGIVSFDTETTDKDAFSAKPVLVSQGVPKAEWKSTYGDPSIFGVDEDGDLLLDLTEGSRFVFEAYNPAVQPLVPIMGAQGIDVVAHNWKYDAHIVNRHWGFMPGQGGKVFDTMAMDWLFDENRRHGLKECCEAYDLFHGLQPFGKLFKKPPKKIQDLRPDLSPSEYAMEIRRDEFLDYAATDAYVTLLLLDYLRDRLKDQWWKDDATGGEDSNLWEYYLKYEEPYIKSVWVMERNGAFCDPERLSMYRPKIEGKMEEIREFYSMMAGEVINVGSTQQMSKLFFDQMGMPVVKQTKGGKSGIKAPSLDKGALELLQPDYPDYVEPLMEYRKIEKLLGTYVNGLSNHIKDYDGKIHGTFNTHVTVTGRLSSSAPNLQNIENPDEDDDRRMEYDIRRAFLAKEGRVLVVDDFSTLEVVITAQLSRDANMIKALLEGLDQHTFTAATMFGYDYDTVIAAKKAKNPTPEQKRLIAARKAAKSLTFGLLYGMGAWSLAQDLNVTEDEAKDYIDKFYNAYPGILDAKGYWEQFCQANGFVLTLMNRRRRLPEIWDNNYSIRARAKRQLFNAIIQGTAGDLMRFYMPAIVNDERLRELDAHLILQIHDEVVVDCPEEHAEEVKNIVDFHLQQSMNYIDWVVPLKADAAIAKTWSEGK